MSGSWEIKSNPMKKSPAELFCNMILSGKLWCKAVETKALQSFISSGHQSIYKGFLSSDSKPSPESRWRLKFYSAIWCYQPAMNQEIYFKKDWKPSPKSWEQYFGLHICLTKHTRWQQTSFFNGRNHSVYAPSQSETALQCNTVSYWLDAYTEWSLWWRQLSH